MSYFIITGAVFALLSVILGAFGAHVLKDIIDSQSLTVYKTATSYQMYHALAIILTGLSFSQVNRPALLKRAGWLFISGIILFAGSLYVLAVSGIKWFGVITPIGGILFVLGWLFFILSFTLKADPGQHYNGKA